MQHGVVAAGHAATADAAGEILRAGGNAFDAAVGAIAAACVAEPVLASLGGGGFLLALEADGTARLYDFFVQTPRQRRREAEIDFRPVLADFGTVTQEFHIGLGATAVPGMPQGIARAHAALGRLPLTEVLAPAIALARAGVTTTPFQAFLFQVVAPIYLAEASSRALFGSTSQPGDLTQTGDTLTNPDLADALDLLAREGARPFYEGEAAAVLLEAARAGGHLTADDLAGYAVAMREPLEIVHSGARILTNPPPSCGGLLIGFALRLLDGLDLAGDGFGAAAHLLPLARAMAATNKARVDSGLADGGDGAAAALLDPAFAQAYRAQVLDRPAAPRGTTHISVVDAAGNAAAASLSNGEGCGHVLPGLGYMPNNMLGEEDLNPRGFHRWPADARLASMMAPTALEIDGRRAVLGSGGSNRIRTAIPQVLLGLIDFGLAPEAAVMAPRLHVERGRLDVEPGLDPDGVAALTDAFPDHTVWPDLNLFFGGVHLAAQRPDGSGTAAGDPRRDGAVAVV